MGVNLPERSDNHTVNRHMNHHTIHWREETEIYTLPVPRTHLSMAGLAHGDSIGLTVTTLDRKLCLRVSDTPTTGETRHIEHTAPNSAQTVEVPVPQQIVDAGGLRNAQIRYLSTPGEITAVITRPSRLTGQLTLRDSDTIYLTGSHYPVRLPDKITTQVTPTDTVWMWLEPHADRLVICLDTTPETAPPQSIQKVVSHLDKFNVNHTIYLPTTLVRTTQISGAKIKWGHDRTRILGVITD